MALAGKIPKETMSLLNIRVTIKGGGALLFAFVSMQMTIPTDPLRMCYRQAQDVCIPGSRCALEIPISRSPTSIHVPFLPLGQESHCLPEPLSMPPSTC